MTGNGQAAGWDRELMNPGSILPFYETGLLQFQRRLYVPWCCFGWQMTAGDDVRQEHSLELGRVTAAGTIMVNIKVFQTGWCGTGCPGTSVGRNFSLTWPHLTRSLKQVLPGPLGATSIPFCITLCRRVHYFFWLCSDRNHIHYTASDSSSCLYYR